MQRTRFLWARRLSSRLTLDGDIATTSGAPTTPTVSRSIAAARAMALVVPTRFASASLRMFRVSAGDRAKPASMA
ncbi:MAG: hypothetical protein COS34_10705 [Lysobacterales bacterium CG02_land_8_20_14_3_00_62_12]|nr:MAG: hypothetical protein COS34_10705 [Xanthomonadales bacterium CG02_land_8_20_14_3_00_62_12]PJA39924.1 MAG: hypothetical protein CO182_08665 [Xanthomonadales bacterium CG_4_9_14_3_um_filter_62_6]